MIRPSASVAVAGRGPLVAVRDRGLEPVVTVGEHERRRRDDAADLRDPRPGSVIGVSEWRTPWSSVVDRGGGSPVGDAASPVAGVRPQIGSRFARVARQQREPVALRLGHRALVGEHVALAGADRQRERADDAVGACGAGRGRR